MSSEPPAGSTALELDHVSKVYDRNSRGLRWRQLLLLNDRPRSPHLALDDVSLRVEPGEAVGLIGPNGAGKSTVLKLVAGVTRPTNGAVRPGGRVGAMIELAVGFHPELTGWENLRCGSLLRGTPRAQLEPALEEIAAFAGIEDAMDMPLKKYSVGMRARLAFALATQFPVDVLAIDEVLAVGDTDFQVQCMDRIRTMVEAGTTLLFVSHEMRLISLMCDRVVRLDEGTVVDDGDAVDVVARYLKQSPAIGERASGGPASIDRYELVPEVEPWGRIEVDAEIDVHRPCRRPTVSLAVGTPTLNPDLVHVLASDRIRELAEPGRYRLRGTSGPFGITNLDLQLTLGISDGASLSDTAEGVVRMVGDGSAWSYVALKPRWEIEQESPEAVHEGHVTTGAGRFTNPSIIEVVDVVKAFRSGRARASLHAALPGRLGVPDDPDLRAIDHLSLEVERGEALGVIGPNGAGKSTLLRLIAGLTRADSGSIRVGAPVLPMLDFGSGMHPFMTGRENARVRARLLGMSAKQAAARMADIEEFADIGDAIDAPVHQYSTGMLTRLGFAVAIHSPGEILLIDELLAVGDEGFRQAALTAVEARRKTGNTVLFVSHEMALIEQVCSRVVRLVHGQVTDDGPVSELLDHPLGSSTPVGVHDATSGVRIHELQLRQRRVPVHGSIAFEGVIDVDEPAPHARLELSYRAVPDDRALVISSEDRYVRSFFIETVEPSGGALARAGRYRFRCVLEDHPVTGTFDVVLAAIDDREGLVLAESREEVLVGHPNPSGVPIPAVAFTWTIEPLGA